MKNTSIFHSLIINIFCLWLPLQLIAAPATTTHTFNVRDGLPSQAVSSVAQDSDGLIWVGTWNGLAFYDGYRFYNFRSSERNGLLSSNRILELQPDDSGNVWFTTYDHRAYILDTSKSRFVPLEEIFPEHALDDYRVRHINRTGDDIWLTDMSGESVIHVVRDDKGEYSAEILRAADIVPGTSRMRRITGGRWILTDNGARLFGTDFCQNGRIADIAAIGSDIYLIGKDGTLSIARGTQPARTLPAAPGVKGVKSLVAAGERYLAAAYSGGVAVYDIRQRKWKVTPVSEGVKSLYTDSAGRIWAYTATGRIMLADTDGKAEYLRMKPTLGVRTIFTEPLFFEDPYGTVWLAAEDGPVGYYDETENIIVPFAFTDTKDAFSKMPSVKKTFIDRQKNLWLISAQGLSLTNFGYNNSSNLTLEPNEETRSVVALPDGSLIAGSASGIVARYAPDGSLSGYFRPIGDATKARLSLSPSPVNFSDKVYALYADRDNNVWLGTKGDGLYLLEPDGNMRHFSRRTGNNGLSCDTVYSIHHDSRGNLWIGTYGAGLFIAGTSPDGSYEFRRVKNYPTDRFRYVRRVLENNKGEYLISTTEGLLTFDSNFDTPENIKFNASVPVNDTDSSLRTANVMQTLSLDNGKTLVATQGGDVQLVRDSSLTSAQLHFSHLTDPDLAAVLSRSNVLSMIQARNGNVFFVRESDIVVYLGESKSIIVLGPNNLGGTFEFTEAMPAIGPDGSIYFAAVGGVVKVDPDELNSNAFAPNIVFTGMHVKGNQYEDFIHNPSYIELESDNRDFSISFAALDYTGNGHIEYAYRIAPDDNWSYLGNNNSLQITNLKPGITRLYIKSTNGDGTWVDNERYIDILVHPTFWESVWSKILMVAIVLVLGYFFVSFYIANRKNRMMKQVRKREREFFINASHRLRTPLTLIGSPVVEVLNSEKLSDTGRQHLEKVSRSANSMLDIVNSMLLTEFENTDVVSDASIPWLSAAELSSAKEAMEAQRGDDENSKGPRDKEVTILIVEDNTDLRHFLRDILSSQYNIITAVNGKDGLEKAEKEQPDFIITDVTMPEMDGLAMVHQIKERKKLSHIPIIILSAKASMEDRMEGLKAGIEDYITKPFSATFLRQRIANIISQRRLLQQAYFEQLGTEMQKADLSPSIDNGGTAADAKPVQARQEYRLDTPQIIEADQVMMEKLMKFIEERIGDETLRIEEMADAMSMGRTVFYGKIKAIVGMSPSDFLRRLRMQRAEELITRSKMNFSQIAFSVGFSDPKYFTKCFKKETGMTPSEYRHKKQEEQNSEG